MKPLDILLTKEAFDQYATRLREEKAREYGMTLEQCDAAIATQQLVNPIIPNNSTQHTSSFNDKTT